ncbi:MAG: hypothetical protein ABI151_18155 [Chitinophagaceae bacterium]
MNSSINRRLPIEKTIEGYLNWLTAINFVALFIGALLVRRRQKKFDRQLLEDNNKSWNERMSGKYPHWNEASSTVEQTI